MLNSEGFYEKLLEGWQAQQTKNGVPYYVNHTIEKTQWEHPFYAKTMEELGDLDNVKYAAYRTAMKMRFLQKRFMFDQVDLKLLSSTLKRHGLDAAHTGRVPVSVVESVVRDLIESCYKPVATLNVDAMTTTNQSQLTPEVMSQLVLSWLLDLYDSKRSGEVRICAVMVALITLSEARLTEKYKLIFQQIMNKNNRVDRPRMQQFLADLTKMPDILQESGAFGGANVRPAVDSCFSQAWSSAIGVSEDEFVAWLLKEPQTVVWLPTMHRLAAAETVKHEARCSVCKAFPIVGFRYKCLQCFNYDLCQQCFFTGAVSKSHKPRHPTQEYCLSTSAKEDTKAFLRTVRNKLSKKHRSKQKPRYLPITGQAYQRTADYGPDLDEPLDMTGVSERGVDVPITVHTQKAPLPPPVIANQSVPVTTAANRSVPATTAANRSEPVMTGAFDIDERRELASIIQLLEDENRQLMSELEQAYSAPPSQAPRSGRSSARSDQSQWVDRDKMDARQEVIEAHNRQLQMQLSRLRSLLIQSGEPQATEPVSSHTYSKHTQNTQSNSTPYNQNQNLQYSIPDHIDSIRHHADSFDYDTPEVVGNNRHRSPAFDKYFRQTPVAGYNHESPTLDNHAARSNNHTPVSNHMLSSNNHTPIRSRTPVDGNYNNIHLNNHIAERGNNHTPVNNHNMMNNHSGQFYDSSAVNGTPDSMAMLDGNDSSDLTIGRTHYSLPPLSESRSYPEEEAQLADIVARLQHMDQIQAAREAVSQHEGAMGEMLRAADQIGQAFSGLVSNGRQTEIDKIEREYESNA